MTPSRKTTKANSFWVSDPSILLTRSFSAVSADLSFSYAVWSSNNNPLMVLPLYEDPLAFPSDESEWFCQFIWATPWLWYEYNSHFLSSFENIVAQLKFQLLAVRGQEKFRPHQLFYRNQIHWLPIVSSPQWSQTILMLLPYIKKSIITIIVVGRFRGVQFNFFLGVNVSCAKLKFFSFFFTNIKDFFVAVVFLKKI
jgi:hypothetical protein